MGKKKYIYVAELANGIVKVGRTFNPKMRLMNISFNGRRQHLDTITALWAWAKGQK